MAIVKSTKEIVAVKRVPKVFYFYFLYCFFANFSRSFLFLYAFVLPFRVFLLPYFYQEILSVEGEVRLRREYAIMKLLRHPNLIRLIDVLENPQEIVIVMEYASQGDLFEYIVTKDNHRLTEEQAKPIFIQIALGKGK